VVTSAGMGAAAAMQAILFIQEHAEEQAETPPLAEAKL